MTVFRREPGTRDPALSSRPEATAVGSSDTRIAPGSRIEGKISGSTAVEIEGEFKGSIDIEGPVTVHHRGVVEGEIYARTVRVGGRVKGDVHAGDRIELAASGSVEGDIAAPRVVIAEGAFFKGQVEMKPQAPPEPRDGES